MLDHLNDAGTLRSRLSRISTVASQFLNVLIFNGHPDETVSGRSYRMETFHNDQRWAWRRRLIDRAFFWEKDHCRMSHEEDIHFARAMLLSSKADCYSQVRLS